jgi:hypothetical protein
MAPTETAKADRPTEPENARHIVDDVPANRLIAGPKPTSALRCRGYRRPPCRHLPQQGVPSPPAARIVPRGGRLSRSSATTGCAHARPSRAMPRRTTPAAPTAPACALGEPSAKRLISPPSPPDRPMSRPFSPRSAMYCRERRKSRLPPTHCGCGSAGRLRLSAADRRLDATDGIGQSPKPSSWSPPRPRPHDPSLQR